MSSSLELFLRRLRDPRWIPNISDYCDARCERCAFRERCWTYALRHHAESFESEPELVPASVIPEEDDIDMDAGETKAYERLEERIHNDPLGTRVENYGMDVWRIMQSLLPAGRNSGWGGGASGSALSNAIEDVWDLALTIDVKTKRAISSFEYNKEEQFEMDAVQTDANGSAKVARLAIAHSRAAWTVMRPAGLLDAGSVEYLIDSLERIESELTDRFPLAMAFVRPGFDEEIPGLVRPWSIMPDEEDEEDDEP